MANLEPRTNELKGTETEKNLLAAFAGESQARNKYTYFASKAKKDGYVQISKIFEETANNEKELVFSSEGDSIWICSNCGHIVVGPKAPEMCPVCNHPKSYFEKKAENY